MNRPIRTIVVGVATVEALDPVLPIAIRLACAVRASLRVVHVFDPGDRAMFAAEAVPVDLGALHRCRRIESVAAALEEQCARFACPDEDVEVRVLVGSACRSLPEFAAEAGADLLVIGATRRGRIWRSILGTTAERVLHEASVPVLVVHQPSFHLVERVLLTTDLSESSAEIHERALDVVEGLFGAGLPKLRSILVLDHHLLLPGLLPEESAEELARGGLDRFLAELRPGVCPIAGRVRVGEPPIEINAEAAAWHADLIVVGTHGRSGFARYVFGSVAAATVRDAARNVLVIPAPTRGVVRYRRQAAAAAEL